MQNDKLLPCPFCGEEAIIHNVEPHTHILAKFMPDCKGESFIECTNCTCAMSGDTEEVVVNAWNTRKPMERIAERLEEKMLTSSSAKAEAVIGMCGASANFYGGEMEAYKNAIEMVKGGVDNAE